MADISSLASLTATKPQIASGGQGGGNAGGVSFMDMLKNGIENTREAQAASEKLSAQAVLGNADMTQVVQSIAKAELMLNTMVSIRDRLLTAYQEIMNTRI